MLDKPSKVGKRGEEAVKKEDKDRQKVVCRKDDPLLDRFYL